MKKCITKALLFLTSSLLFSQDIGVRLYSENWSSISTMGENYLSDPLTLIEPVNNPYSSFSPLTQHFDAIWMVYDEISSPEDLDLLSRRDTHLFLERWFQCFDTELGVSMNISMDLWYHWIENIDDFHDFTGILISQLLQSPFTSVEINGLNHLLFSPDSSTLLTSLKDLLIVYNINLYLGLSDLTTLGIPSDHNYILHSYDYAGRHSTYEKMVEQIYYYTLSEEPKKSLTIVFPMHGRIYQTEHVNYWYEKKSYVDIINEFSPGIDSNEAGGYFFNGLSLCRRKAELIEVEGINGIIIDGLLRDAPGIHNIYQGLRESIQ